MQIPFVFGRTVSGENFTDREKETEHLVTNFKALINTIIVSPRRWGKSSLVEKASGLAVRKNKTLKICKLDLFNIRNEEQFYEAFALSVLRSASSRWEEAVQSARKFMKQIVPKIVLNAELGNEFSLSFDWNELKRKPDEILDLPEKLASDKGIRLVICIDEFQNMSVFEDPVFFQKKLRSHWQTQKNVAYCLYGSKRHMMLDVFTDPSMPFYKFGDMMFLDKIDTGSWIRFIERRFTATGKLISKSQSEQIVRLTDNHPYYVQQLSQQVWLRTEKKCTDDIVEEAFGSIIEQRSLLFATLTETLSTSQINLLRAIISGETSLSSSGVLTKYRLVSSAGVNRSRKSLIEKDILDNNVGTITFQDPLYRAWLAREYFV